MCNYELDNVVGVCTRPTVWTEAYTVYHVLNFPLLSSGHPERVMFVFSSITLVSQLIPLVPPLATRFGQKMIAVDRYWMEFSMLSNQSKLCLQAYSFPSSLRDTWFSNSFVAVAMVNAIVCISFNIYQIPLYDVHAKPLKVQLSSFPHPRSKISDIPSPKMQMQTPKILQYSLNHEN